MTSASNTQPAAMPDEEWRVRVDLAAAYRLAAIYGWTDLNNTHFSMRIPGSNDQFLLNPFGMLFDEITASSLIKVDHNGNILGQSDYPANPAGFVIHGAVHMAVAEANCIIHTHSRFGTAVATQKSGLLPASQKALTLMGWVGYHDFEGAALDLDERPRIVGDLGDKKILILRNHGLMSVGRTVGEAFVWMYRIETACRIQIDALSGGSELNPISDATQEHAIAQGLKMYGEGGFIQPGREWPTLVRQLERLDGTDYRR
ncbi:MAG: class II aldolase/adducin family protein [Gammaproteobacteria bacterium]|jgi:ribulose-5-phosphate 4-epimerase/fuculose-1-phosphate aldolase|nr:class II aldolase/adducin family protein [Gammaproteobacteria bacterium]MDX2460491.1 class II aldolase/adducin family protein [Gammaproteobacteria bacterium]